LDLRGGNDLDRRKGGALRSLPGKKPQSSRKAKPVPDALAVKGRGGKVLHWERGGGEGRGVVRMGPFFSVEESLWSRRGKRIKSKKEGGNGPGKGDDFPTSLKRAGSVLPPQVALRRGDRKKRNEKEKVLFLLIRQKGNQHTI